MNRKDIHNQSDMAKALGITGAQVSLTLSGHRHAKYETAVKWAQIVGTDINLWQDSGRVNQRKLEFENFINVNNKEKPIKKP